MGRKRKNSVRIIKNYRKLETRQQVLMKILKYIMDNMHYRM